MTFVEAATPTDLKLGKEIDRLRQLIKSKIETFFDWYDEVTPQERFREEALFKEQLLKSRK